MNFTGGNKLDTNPQQGSAMKFDAGKPRMSLIERCFIEGMARVLTFGAKKYAARNYRNGAEVSRYVDAAMRHLVAFADGENNDPESGENHLHHAACCLMMADWMHRNKPALDDRVAMPLPKTPLPTIFAPSREGGFVGQADEKHRIASGIGFLMNSAQNKEAAQQCQSSK